MKTIQVYDKPMCCSTGICGPEVDPVLPRFAADLEWLKLQGHRVERYNLAQQPMAFAENEAVRRLLSSQGTSCLPLTFIDGRLAGQSIYPSRDELSRWTADNLAAPVATTEGEAPCCGVGCCC